MPPASSVVMAEKYKKEEEKTKVVELVKGGGGGAGKQRLEVVEEKKKVIVDEKLMAEKYYLFNSHCVDATTIRFWQKRGAMVRMGLTLPLLFFCRYHPIFMVLALQVLDMSDCFVTKMVITRWRKKRVGPIVSTMMARSSLFYQNIDKLSDLLSYIIAVALLQRYCLAATPKLLWALIGWRCIGVALFCKFKNDRYLIPFVDLVKEVIVLQALIALSLTGTWGLCWMHHHTLVIFLVLVVGKVAFEAKWHRQGRAWTP